MAPQPCSKDCVACRICNSAEFGERENEFGAIQDASGGYLASFVEEHMRWITKNGPGGVVDGDFHYAQVGHTFILYPKEKFSSAGVLIKDEWEE
jgi:hypothetical protein